MRSDDDKVKLIGAGFTVIVLLMSAMWADLKTDSRQNREDIAAIRAELYQIKGERGTRGREIDRRLGVIEDRLDSRAAK